MSYMYTYESSVSVIRDCELLRVMTLDGVRVSLCVCLSVVCLWCCSVLSCPRAGPALKSLFMITPLGPALH